MPYANTRDPRIMEALIERAFRSIGFVLVYDGSKAHEFKGGEAPSFFTRVYHWKLDGEWSRTWLRFTYDLRTGHCDFKITLADLDDYCNAINRKPEAIETLKKIKELMNNEKPAQENQERARTSGILNNGPTSDEGESVSQVIPSSIKSQD